jgi:hypothetical protein
MNELLRLIVRPFSSIYYFDIQCKNRKISPSMSFLSQNNRKSTAEAKIGFEDHYQGEE